MAGFMPSASLTVNESGAKVDVNVWSPEFGKNRKLRATANVADAGGAN